MLPSFTLSGVLPPFQPEHGPAVSAGRSPYRILPEDLVAAFATSLERRSLLRDLFEYRRQLRGLGLRDGFQWIDGSFLEDVEMHKGRAPRDIDLVTFFSRPANATNLKAWSEFVERHQHLLNPEELAVDCYYVDMSIPPEVVVGQATYWYGLFSHQRETSLWKGIVQLDLAADETVALKMIEVADAN
jgi:hypothetical protein